MANVPHVARSQVQVPVSQATIEDLQDQRRQLVEQYVGARPTGSDGWKLGAGIGTGAVAAGIGVGAVLLSNRGRGPLYQGLNLMFIAPSALAIGGGVGYLLGSRAGEMATRPTGAAADAQVAATREQLLEQITNVDEQLTAADGRRPQPLPQLDDDAKVSLGRIAGHTGAGIGLGLLATAGTLAGYEALRGTQIAGGPTMLAPMLAPAIAAGAISYLDQRDEAAGGEGSFLRAAGIGAAAMGAASLVPALAPIPLPVRVAGGVAVGALLGSLTHMVSASSRD